jgi:DeoR family transcriptional regulator, fructose operon transcriptional repressor
MYTMERIKEIVGLLNADSSVSVAELADRFGVSRATIRRDLNKLFESGVLERTYGGAIKSNPLQSMQILDEAPFYERRNSCDEQKNRIGMAAADHIENGETIFIDGGTTTECLIGHLKTKQNLTVVTYALNIMYALSKLDTIKVIGLGGVLHHSSLTFGGVLVDTVVRTFNIQCDKGFVAAGGVSAEFGISNIDLEQIPMKLLAMNSSHQVFLLADSSKVGNNATALVAPINKIHKLITDNGAPQSEVEAIRKQGVSVQIV